MLGLPGAEQVVLERRSFLRLVEAPDERDLRRRERLEHADHPRRVDLARAGAQGAESSKPQPSDACDWSTARRRSWTADHGLNVVSVRARTRLVPASMRVTAWLPAERWSARRQGRRAPGVRCARTAAPGALTASFSVRIIGSRRYGGARAGEIAETLNLLRARAVSASARRASRRLCDRWTSTVCTLTNSAWAISLFVSPRAASSATRRSLGVSSPGGPAGRPPTRSSSEWASRARPVRTELGEGGRRRLQQPAREAPAPAPARRPAQYEQRPGPVEREPEPLIAAGDLVRRRRLVAPSSAVQRRVREETPGMLLGDGEFAQPGSHDARLVGLARLQQRLDEIRRHGEGARVVNPLALGESPDAAQVAPGPRRVVGEQSRQTARPQRLQELPADCRSPPPRRSPPVPSAPSLPGRPGPLRAARSSARRRARGSAPGRPTGPIRRAPGRPPASRPRVTRAHTCEAATTR